MEEVTCPRCKGRGDIPAPSGSGVMKCFSCGGRGVIDSRDLAWKSKWASTGKEISRSVEKKSAQESTDQPAQKQKAAAKPSRPRAKTKTVPPSATAQLGRSQLHVDASEGYVKGVLEQLESGVDVNVRDNDGRTPLHWPAYRGHQEVVRILLEHGADVNATDNNGRTPLKMAIIGNHQDVIDLLKEHGAE